MKTTYLPRAVALVACLLAGATASAATQTPGAKETFARSICEGARGPDVEALQQRLRAEGFLDLAARVSRGYFDGVTAEALARYQLSRGLKPTGVLGRDTRDRLNGSPAVATETSSPPPPPVVTVTVTTSDPEPPPQPPPPLVTVVPGDPACGIPGLTLTQIAKAGGHHVQTKVITPELLGKVWRVEADGRMHLVGDTDLTHKAYGPLQTRRTDTGDIAKKFGVSISPEDCQGNWHLSEKAFRLYTGYWAMRYQMRTGRPITPEVICRIWNGGPDGAEEPETHRYWRKVQAADHGLVDDVLAMRR